MFKHDNLKGKIAVVTGGGGCYLRFICKNSG